MPVNPSDEKTEHDDDKPYILYVLKALVYIGSLSPRIRHLQFLFLTCRLNGIIVELRSTIFPSAILEM